MFLYKLTYLPVIITPEGKKIEYSRFMSTMPIMVIASNFAEANKGAITLLKKEWDFEIGKLKGFSLINLERSDKIDIILNH